MGSHVIAVRVAARTSFHASRCPRMPRAGPRKGAGLAKFKLQPRPQLARACRSCQSQWRRSGMSPGHWQPEALAGGRPDRPACALAADGAGNLRLGSAQREYAPGPECHVPVAAIPPSRCHLQGPLVTSLRPGQPEPECQLQVGESENPAGQQLEAGHGRPRPPPPPPARDWPGLAARQWQRRPGSAGRRVPGERTTSAGLAGP